jgi:hypothetical protein
LPPCGRWRCRPCPGWRRPLLVRFMWPACECLCGERVGKGGWAEGFGGADGRGHGPLHASRTPQCLATQCGHRIGPAWPTLPGRAENAIVEGRTAAAAAACVSVASSRVFSWTKGRRRALCPHAPCLRRRYAAPMFGLAARASRSGVRHARTLNTSADAIRAAPTSPQPTNTHSDSAPAFAHRRLPTPRSLTSY